MEYGGHRNRTEDDVRSCIPPKRAQWHVRRRSKDPERPEAESGVQIALRSGGKVQPVLPKVPDQSTPVYLSPVVVMLITRTWMEIWRLGTSMDLR